MNLPTHVNICGFLFHIRNRNFSSSFIWVKFGTKRANLENRFSLSGWLMVQFMTKCLSSSRTWEIEQLRSSIFVLGRVYLPYSIARVCELVLNWDMAILYLWFLIASYLWQKLMVESPFGRLTLGRTNPNPQTPGSGNSGNCCRQLGNIFLLCNISTFQYNQMNRNGEWGYIMVQYIPNTVKPLT